MRAYRVVIPLVAALVMGGCAIFDAQKDFIKPNYKAADMLLAQVAAKLPKGSTVIMATVVNIDALENSSTLGRSISEQIASRFSQAGYNMIEMKFRDSVYMKRNEGELMLTREIGEVAKSHNAQAVIAGTYAEAGSTVYLTIKVINPGTNVVMAATDYALPIDGDVRAMLGKRAKHF